jgi:hypothetical protein
MRRLRRSLPVLPPPHVRRRGIHDDSTVQIRSDPVISAAVTCGLTIESGRPGASFDLVQMQLDQKPVMGCLPPSTTVVALKPRFIRGESETPWLSTEIDGYSTLKPGLADVGEVLELTVYLDAEDAYGSTV